MKAQQAFTGQRVFRIRCRCSGSVIVQAAQRSSWRCERCRTTGVNDPPEAFELAAGGALPALPFLTPTASGADARLAVQLGRGGAAQAEAKAGEAWRDRARALVVQLAQRQPEVTSDDVWEAGLELPDGASGRALGAVMTWAARAGFLAKTDRVRRSTSPSSHGDPMTIWASLAHQPNTPCDPSSGMAN